MVNMANAVDFAEKIDERINEAMNNYFEVSANDGASDVDAGDLGVGDLELNGTSAGELAEKGISMDELTAEVNSASGGEGSYTVVGGEVVNMGSVKGTLILGNANQMTDTLNQTLANSLEEDKSTRTTVARAAKPV